jgi:hypothetical protein
MNLQNILLYLLVFSITAAHSDVKLSYWLTGQYQDEIANPYHGFLIPFILAALLWAVKLLARKNDLDTNRKRSGIVIAILLWFVALSISMFANVSSEIIIRNYIGGVISPLFIYMALRNISLTRVQTGRIFLAVSLGAMTTLVLGILAYYNEWGIPDLVTLIYSRYNVARMSTYRQMTFGNIGNMAQFLILIGAPFLALAFDKSRSRSLRCWFAFCFLLVGLNLLIVQALTAFIVMLVAALVIVIFNRHSKFLILIFAVIGFLWLIYPDFFADFSKLFQTRSTSIAERFQAMRDGWSIFCDNWLFGIGPGISYLFIPATTAHQFFIQQGVEAGVLGLISSVLLVLMVFIRTLTILFANSRDQYQKERFLMIIGPFAFLLYGMIANNTLNLGIINVWVNLLAVMLALVDFRPAAAQVNVNLIEDQKINC